MEPSPAHKDIVAPVVRRAEQLLAERGAQPPPVGITPHKLRHTFASILVAIGKDPVYSHMMRRSPQERDRLKALVEGHHGTLDRDPPVSTAKPTS